MVNTEKVKLPKDGEVGWEFLFSSGDPTHTSLLDEMREVFAAVLIQKGLSPNTEKVEESKVAANEIRDIKGRISLFSSEPLAPVLREDITVAHAFTTHAIQAQQTSKKFKFLFPKEGNTVWTDNYAIPVTTQKVKEAHTFIDFFLEPENALKLTLSNHLNTPNHSAWLKLEKDMREDPVLYPSDERLQKMIFLRMLDKNLLEMNALWTDVKS